MTSKKLQIEPSVEESADISTPIEINTNEWMDGELSVLDSFKNMSKVGGNNLAPVWKHYYRSVLRNTRTKRCKAMCKYCNIEIDGRIEQLWSHSSTCLKIPAQICSEILLMQALKRATRPITSKTESNEPIKIKTDSIRNYFDVTKMKDADQKKAEKLLARAIVDAGVPFSMVENTFFKLFLKEIRPAFKIPSRKTISGRILQSEYAEAILHLQDQLKSLQYLTIGLDGWEDASGRSIYAFIACSTTLKKSLVLDILDFSGKQQTAEFILNETINVIERVGTNFTKFNSIVTDNCSVMLKFRRLLCSRYPHIENVRCIAHSINLIASDYLKNQYVKETFQKCCKLVNYFRASHFWYEKLLKWGKSNNTIHKLETYTETRWYSISKVFQSVYSYEAGFKNCVQLYSQNKSTYPSIPKAINEIISDRRNFENTEVCSQVTRLVANAIAESESNETTCGICFGSYLKLFQNTKEIEKLDVVTDYCLSILQKRFREFFENPIFILGMLMEQRYHNFVVNSMYTAADAYYDLLSLGKKWGFMYQDVQDLKEALKNYYQKTGYFLDYSKDGCTSFEWWNQVKSEHTGISTLKTIALMIISIVPQNANTERLFSSLGHQHSKSRNRLNMDSLRMIGHLKCYYNTISNAKESNMFIGEVIEENEIEEIEVEENDNDEKDEICEEILQNAKDEIFLEKMEKNDSDITLKEMSQTKNGWASIVDKYEMIEKTFNFKYFKSQEFQNQVKPVKSKRKLECEVVNWNPCDLMDDDFFK